MNRKQLSAAILSLASAKGYTVVSAPEQAMPRMVKKYPCAWLSPLRIVKFEGRRTGRITYAVKLRLMCASTTEPEATNGKWEAMEEDVIEIFTDLTLDDGVIAVEKLVVKPSSADLTNHGEMSQTAEAEVTIWY